MSIFRNGPRARGLPRARPAPEVNIVQNPTMTRAIQRLAGTKQAHVQPALQEGLGTQLLAGDIREDPRTAFPASFAALLEVVPDAANIKRATFAVPHVYDRVCVLRRLHVYGAEDWLAGPSVPTSIVYTQVQESGQTWGAGGQTLITGQRLVTGYATQTIGVLPPTPPGNSDFLFANGLTGRSNAGWNSVPLNGITGGYLWRGVIGGAAGVEILEDFHRDYGPRVIVFPGGTWNVYVLDNNFHGYYNIWWDEYPLS